VAWMMQTIEDIRAEKRLGGRLRRGLCPESLPPLRGSCAPCEGVSLWVLRGAAGEGLGRGEDLGGAEGGARCGGVARTWFRRGLRSCGHER